MHWTKSKAFLPLLFLMLSHLVMAQPLNFSLFNPIKKPPPFMGIKAPNLASVQYLEAQLWNEMNQPERLPDSVIRYNWGLMDGEFYYDTFMPETVGFIAGLAPIFPLAWGSLELFLAVSGTAPIAIFLYSRRTPRDIDNPSNPRNGLLLSDPIYLKGFQNGATKRKRIEPWKGYGMGVVAGLLIYTAATIAIRNQ